MKQLLLISNSTLHGSGYLEHCTDEILNFLYQKKKVVFIPFARPGGISHDDYTSIAKKKFVELGFELKGIHEFASAEEAIDYADAVFTGGGNSFVLINSMYEYNVIKPLRAAIENGLLYMGTSAGSNIAGQSIKTTNDMPIVYPPSFDALGCVSFNINPHYLDSDPSSKHMGETRETRISEFLVFNDLPVIGLREGAMLQIQNSTITLKGVKGARVFQKDKEPKEYETNDVIRFD